MKVTPWEVKGMVNYSKLMKQFGLQPMKTEGPFKDNLLYRRGIIFAQRDFNKISDAISKKKKYVMMTGLMPSGKFHFGHKIIADQIIFHQKLGAKIYVAVADIEAYNSRTTNIEKLRKTAIEEYLKNYIALGLKPKNCDFYFQSSRSKDGKKSNAYYALAGRLARHATFNEFKAIYGEITPGKMTSSLLQAADMLHPQLEEFENKIPIIIPVGADQDPHIRIARDLAKRYGKLELSSTYNKFLPGLKGGKMSSSDETSYIALTDKPEEAAKKIKKYAFSGGQATLIEHRKKGGNPEIDTSYQMLKYGLEENDNKLKKIHDDYKSGKLLTGELKQILIKKIEKFLKNHQAKRSKVKIDKYI